MIVSILNGEMKMSKNSIIPIFYSSDGNYLPYLSVSLTSLKENADKTRNYCIYVLYSGTLGKDKKAVEKLKEDWFDIRFVNVGKRFDEMKQFLTNRDYYTNAIYYRLFIAEMFPEYEKAVYLDVDTVVLGDVSKLYDTDLDGYYIGAVPDQSLALVQPFRDYTKNALDIDGDEYFNSGVIVMNLDAFRKEKFLRKFCALFASYDFVVAPDQDCLNLLCKGKVKFLPAEWNTMPISCKKAENVEILHYNFSKKPWHYYDVMYQEYFWEYAKKTEFYQRICAERENFSNERALKDIEGEKALIALTIAEANNEHNFIRSVGKELLKKWRV